MPDVLVTLWNPAAERMCDYTAGEMVGDSLHILSPPEEQDRSHSVTDAPASGEPVPTFDTVRLRKSGTRVPVAVSTSPIFDAEGEVIGIVTFHSDITERVKAAELAQRMATVVERSHEAIIGTVHPDGNIVSQNPAAERMYGLQTPSSPNRSSSDRCQGVPSALVPVMDGHGAEPWYSAHDQPVRDVVIHCGTEATRRQRPCVLRLRGRSLSESGSGSTPTPERPRRNRSGSLEGWSSHADGRYVVRFRHRDCNGEMTCGMNVSTGTKQRPLSPTP